MATLSQAAQNENLLIHRGTSSLIQKQISYQGSVAVIPTVTGTSTSTRRIGIFLNSVNNQNKST